MKLDYMQAYVLSLATVQETSREALKSSLPSEKRARYARQAHSFALDCLSLALLFEELESQQEALASLVALEAGARLLLETGRGLPERLTSQLSQTLELLTGFFDIFPKDIERGTLTREQREELARVREELQAGLDRELREGLRAREEARS